MLLRCHSRPLLIKKICVGVSRGAVPLDFTNLLPTRAHEYMVWIRSYSRLSGHTPLLLQLLSDKVPDVLGGLKSRNYLKVTSANSRNKKLLSKRLSKFLKLYHKNGATLYPSNNDWNKLLYGRGWSKVYVLMHIFCNNSFFSLFYCSRSSRYLKLVRFHSWKFSQCLD